MGLRCGLRGGLSPGLLFVSVWSLFDVVWVTFCSLGSPDISSCGVVSGVGQGL